MFFHFYVVLFFDIITPVYPHWYINYNIKLWFKIFLHLRLSCVVVIFSRSIFLAAVRPRVGSHILFFNYLTTPKKTSGMFTESCDKSSLEKVSYDSRLSFENKGSLNPQDSKYCTEKVG